MTEFNKKMSFRIDDILAENKKNDNEEQKVVQKPVDFYRSVSEPYGTCPSQWYQQSEYDFYRMRGMLNYILVKLPAKMPNFGKEVQPQLKDVNKLNTNLQKIRVPSNNYFLI